MEFMKDRLVFGKGFQDNDLIIEPLVKLLELTFLSFRPAGEIFSSANSISTIKDSSLCSE